MQGPLGEDPTRISTRSSVEDVCRIMEGPLRQKCSRTQCLRTPPRRRCASLRRTYHKSHFYARSSPKNKTHRTCMSLEPFYTRIYKKNAAPQDRDTRFVRACTVKPHMDMSQEPFLCARAILCENLQEKTTPEARARTLI